MTDSRADSDAPPAGEELHLPGASAIPLLNATGLALAVVGLTMGPSAIIAGLVLFLVTLVIWVRDVRSDIDELPPEHHH